MSTLNFNYDIKKITNHTYTISFSQSCPQLLNSILESHILLAGCRINSNNNKITFHASNIKNLSEFMNYCEEKYGVRKVQYNDALKIIWCLSQQIYFLEKLGFTFYKLDMKNIIVIDDTKFIYLDNEALIPIVKTKEDKLMLEFFKPFKRNGFLSTEIRGIIQLPKLIDYRAIYQSLAQLIYFLLFNKIPDVNSETNLNINPYNENYYEYATVERKYGLHHSIVDELKPICYTKLYWFLLRNLSFYPKHRSIFFI